MQAFALSVLAFSAWLMAAGAPAFAKEERIPLSPDRTRQMLFRVHCHLMGELPIHFVAQTDTPLAITGKQIDAFKGLVDLLRWSGLGREAVLMVRYKGRLRTKNGVPPSVWRKALSNDDVVISPTMILKGYILFCSSAYDPSAQQYDAAAIEGVIHELRANPKIAWQWLQPPPQ